MKVVVVSASVAGRTVAEGLPYEWVHGPLAATLALRWHDADALVCVADASSTVRAAAPLVAAGTGPAVVCVDEAATWVVPLLDGRVPADVVAVEVADRLDADAVITASSGGVSLQGLEAFAARGDVDGLASAMSEGGTVALAVDDELGAWPLPSSLASLPEGAGLSRAWRVVVSDRAVEDAPRRVVLAPPSLVVGVGLRRGAPAREVDDLVAEALDGAGLARDALGEVATAQETAGELGVLALGLPVRAYGRERLLGARAPAKVAEAAARRAAGRDAAVVVPVRFGQGVAVAVARRARPRGRLALVGLGPGDADHRTPAAAAAVLDADVVVASGTDLELVRDLLRDRHDVVERLPGDEHARVRQALAEAEHGRRVALLCSGDAGVYALAPLACELASDTDADVEVVPGITAATSAGALLGAPLGHDFVLISLSDAMTPWEVIASRIRAAGEADLVAVFYDPRSGGRPDQLARARRILLEHRKPETPVGIVTDAFRPEEDVTITTLGDLDPTLVGMTTTVIVGSTTSAVVDGRMVTPPGYLP